MADMDKDPCHELEIARAELSGVRERLRNPVLADSRRRTLEIVAAGLRKEIEWWRPSCERELRREEGDG